MRVLGARLRTARAQAGWSQQELANRLPSYASYSGIISKWENGVQASHITQIAEIALVLEVSLDFLLQDTRR